MLPHQAALAFLSGVSDVFLVQAGCDDRDLLAQCTLQFKIWI